MTPDEPAPAARPRRRRRLPFALAAVALGLLLAAVTGEVALRILDVHNEPRRHFDPGIYVAHPELGWVLQPSYQGVHQEYAFAAPTSTNELGFRGPSWTDERRQADLRVLVLGDSCTFGRGVADGEDYPAQLEAILRARGLDAAVFNAGVPGYDTTQELQLAPDLLERVDPHVVVVAWLPNDVLEPSVETMKHVQILDGHLVHDVERYREWKENIDHKGLYRSELYRFFRVRTKLIQAWLGMRRGAWSAGRSLTPEDMSYSTDPLLEIHAAAQARGAETVLVLFPRQEEVEDEGVSLAHHAHVAELARARGVHVVDLPHAWRAGPPDPSRYLPKDAVHLTPPGYREVAEALAALPVFDRE